MVANTPASRKAKGRNLQLLTRDKILATFPELTERDIRSVPMGVPGADILLSEQASKKFPFSVENKNTENLNIWNALKQSESGTKERDLFPLLVFKRNHTDVYCAMKFDLLLNLLKQISELNNQVKDIKPMGDNRGKDS